MKSLKNSDRNLLNVQIIDDNFLLSNSDEWNIDDDLLSEGESAQIPLEINSLSDNMEFNSLVTLKKNAKSANLIANMKWIEESSRQIQSLKWSSPKNQEQMTKSSISSGVCKMSLKMEINCLLKEVVRQSKLNQLVFKKSQNYWDSKYHVPLSFRGDYSQEYVTMKDIEKLDSSQIN